MVEITERRRLEAVIIEIFFWPGKKNLEIWNDDLKVGDSKKKGEWILFICWPKWGLRALGFPYFS